MVKNNYSIPLTGELMDKLKGCNHFTKLDLRLGYINVCIREGDEWKTTFTTGGWTYESTVMFFGQINTPMMFQTMMNELLQVIAYVIIYIDNILIFTKPGQEEEHNQIIKKILDLLQKNNLYLKPKKCFFAQKEIEFLEVWVLKNRVWMDNEKVQVVQEWPCLSRVKQVQKFLRLANYYWRFIQGFRAIAKPLYKLTKKDQQFKWEPQHEATFKQLKQAFTKAPVLDFLDSNKELQVKYDALDFATGAVLSAKGEDSLWCPYAFISHGLTGA